jgi:hypothetical protein
MQDRGEIKQKEHWMKNEVCVFCYGFGERQTSGRLFSLYPKNLFPPDNSIYVFLNNFLFSGMEEKNRMS